MTELRCHCGNVTTIGKRLPFSSPPALKGHCLLCRCDEHVYQHASPSNEFPGCGPLCQHRPEKEQRKVVRSLETRAPLLSLIEWYKRLEYTEL